jgi:toxin HigB-1
MKIWFTSGKLSKTMSCERDAAKVYGTDCARMIMRRLAEIEAAPSMADIPPHAGCHPLKGDKKEKYALKLKQPYRLIIKPKCEEIPLRDDGGVDLSKVTEILVLKVVDYH